MYNLLKAFFRLDDVPPKIRHAGATIIYFVLICLFLLFVGIICNKFITENKGNALIESNDKTEIVPLSVEKVKSNGYYYWLELGDDDVIPINRKMNYSESKRVINLTIFETNPRALRFKKAIQEKNQNLRIDIYDSKGHLIEENIPIFTKKTNIIVSKYALS